MSNIIEFRNVVKKYPNFSLNEINFDIPKGYITGFIGPNGSGKTTSIKLLLSMAFRDAGEIYINDSLIEDNNYLSNIGIVMDDSFLMKDWYIKDISEIISPFFKAWDEDLFNNYLRRFNIDKSYKVEELSKGMTIKLMLATALSHDAKLLILDEPTSGLDPSSREEICDILQEYVQDEDRSVLFSTHITADLDAIADNIVFILNGRIIFSGLKDELLAKYKLIKGGLDDLNDLNKSSLIGIKKTNYSFEALVDHSLIFENKEIIEESCSLEEIVLFFNREEKNEDNN